MTKSTIEFVVFMLWIGVIVAIIAELFHRAQAYERHVYVTVVKKPVVDKKNTSSVSNDSLVYELSEGVILSVNGVSGLKVSTWQLK